MKKFFAFVKFCKIILFEILTTLNFCLFNAILQYIEEIKTCKALLGHSFSNFAFDVKDKFITRPTCNKEEGTKAFSLDFSECDLSCN